MRERDNVRQIAHLYLEPLHRLVNESYDPQHELAEPIVAIDPKQGTFWSDHPVGVVNRSWVTRFTIKS
jgi:hypothetical protein